MLAPEPKHFIFKHRMHVFVCVQKRGTQYFGGDGGNGEVHVSHYLGWLKELQLKTSITSFSVTGVDRTLFFFCKIKQSILVASIVLSSEFNFRIIRIEWFRYNFFSSLERNHWWPFHSFHSLVWSLLYWMLIIIKHLPSLNSFTFSSFCL